MKGVSQAVWIIAAVILMLVVLVIVISLVMKGQTATGTTVSEVDLINCCKNCCAHGPTYADTQCITSKASKGTESLGALWTALRKNQPAIAQCEQIPLCSCGA